MAQMAELTRGVMMLQQTEQWHFLTDAPMHALRKPPVNFEGCMAASQCIGPIDVPNPADAWQVTVAAKKKAFTKTYNVSLTSKKDILKASITFYYFIDCVKCFGL